MGWLLFMEPASVAGRHAMQLGLGAAAITKFCHKKLRMRTTAIELNPQVLAVCRRDRKSTRLNSSHTVISYAVFCLRSEENTSELQSHSELVCRLLLDNKLITLHYRIRCHLAMALDRDIGHKQLQRTVNRWRRVCP